MIKIVSVEQMREIEAAADSAGMPYAAMMQNAGRAVAERAKIILAKLSSEPKITVLVGPGNNGGDALVAGKFLAQETNAQVRFYLLKARAEDDPLMNDVLGANLFVANAQEDQRFRVLTNLVAGSDMVIDGLFGIGVRLPVQDETAKLLRAVRQALHEYEGTNADFRAFLDVPEEPQPPKVRAPFVFAIDCPTGLNCDTGELDQNAIYANETITFIAAKPGLLKFPGAAAVGKLTISSIGVPPNTAALRHTTTTLVSAADVQSRMPSRGSDSNKGSYGKTLVIGGSTQYTGAPALSAHAAYRSGAGLVCVAVPASVLPDIRGTLLEAIWAGLPESNGALSESAASEVITRSVSFDSLLLGPGLSNGAGEFMKALLASAASLSNVVIDADGLNLLSEIENWWSSLPPETILTPHPGEMGRLCGINTQDVQSSRWELASQKAIEWNAIVVLKGAHTVIATPDGQTAILPFKTSALATAGTGDVLAGLIAGLLAQGLKPFDAALVGSYVHGLAGVKAGELVGDRASTATDVSNALAAAWLALEQ